MKRWYGRWGVRVLVVTASLLAVDQVMLYTVLSDDILFGTTIAPFAPPLFADHQRQNFAKYEEMLRTDRERFMRLSLFDRELGWCPRPGQVLRIEQYDQAGRRLGAGPFPNDPERWVALLGCSFTHGSEVGNDETWGVMVDEAWPDVDVGNFGVGGYGVDQALLRFRRDVEALEPDEVWLGFFPRAALRVSSRFPPLYDRWQSRTVNFKPSFSLDANQDLALHPSPASVPEDIPRLLRDPAAFFRAMREGDPWIERAPAAYSPEGTHLLHYSALARVALTAYERRGRDVKRLLADDQSDLYRLNRTIVLTLAREVGESGKRFRMLVLPCRDDLFEVTRNGRGHWQTFVNDIGRSGLSILDLSQSLLEAGADTDDGFWMPGGHYSPLANAVVARAITEAWRD